MRKILLSFIILFVLSSISFAGVTYKYHFPKPPAQWGSPVSFNNLSPGFFQVMFQDKAGIVRIATYGIAGGTMDTLKDPELLMVFTFDQEKVSLTDK
jgi:hypothetical protein